MSSTAELSKSSLGRGEYGGEGGLGGSARVSEPRSRMGLGGYVTVRVRAGSESGVTSPGDPRGREHESSLKMERFIVGGRLVTAGFSMDVRR